MTAVSAGSARVRVELPAALGEVTGGARHVDVDVTEPATVADVLTVLSERFPLLDRRIRDERGEVRRFVNVYVDGDDIRGGDSLATPVGPESVVHVLPSIAGGG